MATLKKSSFNFSFGFGDRYAWFNQITNQIALLDDKQHDLMHRNGFEHEECKELVGWMTELGILVPRWRNEAQLLRQYADRFIHPFEFTLELSRVCNFKCTYCYQNGTHDPHKVISQNVINACYQYLEHVFSTGDIDEFELNFIGGEPMLHSERLIDVYDRVSDLLAGSSIRWRTVIDTNGSMLPATFLERCSNTTFSISLTLAPDHNRNRPSLGGRGTFDKIVGNLIANRAHFGSRDNQLIIRYNLNHQNAGELPEFISFLATLAIDGLSLMVVNTVNYDFNHGFHNQLGETDFVEHCGVALQELVRHNISVCTLPYGAITPCHVFRPYSCKVFFDGRLNGCDVSDEPGEGNIFELIKGKTLPGRQSLNPLTHKMCQGEYKICNLQVFPLRPYLTSYVRAIEAGKRNLFCTFEEHGRLMRQNWGTLLAERENQSRLVLAQPASPFVIL
jgi:sulfatase maturation enzyme AslB (radical SAM superfamily)